MVRLPPRRLWPGATRCPPCSCGGLRTCLDLLAASGIASTLDAQITRAVERGLAGVDWRYLAESGLESLPNPRINLIQGVRHAHEGTEFHRYLAHRAIRVCVSREVADAISATERVEGPILTRSSP